MTYSGEEVAVNWIEDIAKVVDVTVIDAPEPTWRRIVSTRALRANWLSATQTFYSSFIFLYIYTVSQKTRTLDLCP